MSGLLRRIRRPGAAEENQTEPSPAPASAHGSAPTPADGSHAAADGRRLPAGAAPEDLERRRTTGRRGRLRRRARFLRRARELALRDLGGLVYEARRREQDGGALVEEKVRRLAALDEELHALDAELGAPRSETVLREPGIGGTCPRCGELHASEARFCSDCGLDLAAARAPRPAAEAETPTEATAPDADAAPVQAGNGRTIAEQPATEHAQPAAVRAAPDRRA